MVDGIGRVLGDRYRLTALIGTGASASVYLADDRKLGRQVAVKVLHPALVDDAAFLRRFREEARSAAQLNHPGLMAVYDTGEEDSGPYLVLQYLGGGSLRAMLDVGHRLSVSQVAALGVEAGQALEAADAAGIVHRDIKPANMLFGSDGRLRLADFGLARALSESGFTDHSDRLVGTARYAAPEQARGVRVDGKADVYALGLVLIECATGTVPLLKEGPVETLMARLETPVPVPPELGPLVPLLERMGQPDPASRPSADEVVDALLALTPSLARPEPLPLAGVDLAEPGGDDDLTVLPSDDRTGLLPPVEGAPPTGRHPRRRWILAGLAALLVVLGGGGAAVWAITRPPTYPVPDVGNGSIQEARTKLAQAMAASKDVKWKVVERAEFSRTTAVDGVTSQSPGPQTQLRDGGTVTVAYSKGQPPVNIPPVAGKSVADATKLLQDARLVPGPQINEANETVAAGLVLTSKVGAQRDPTVVPEQSVVSLVVSTGPAPRTVPDVTGKSQADATAAITGAGLRVAVGPASFSDAAVGTVVSSDPPAGRSVSRDSTVTISLSKGPDLVTVPDVKGMKAQAAINKLQDAGLQVTGQFGPPNGKVLITDPGAGSQVPRNTSVVIYLQP
ncbi:MAG TPA: PASTA domain-containing protein [Acidimicrobiales bacterium]|jgi:serine/threonine-protein kinase